MIHSILFTGHMIDAKDREEPRFPPQKENAVRSEIKKQLLKETALTKNRVKGIAAGACGGDILFHEVCLELDIKSEMYLALPATEFKKASVSFAGKDWTLRFNRLIKKIPVQIGVHKKDTASEDLWGSANLHMLNKALKNGGENMTLIALWNRKGGDGDGGTEHMVKIAKGKSARVNIININKI